MGKLAQKVEVCIFLISQMVCLIINVCVLIMSLGFEKIVIIISRVEASFSEMKSERTLLIKSRII